MFEAVNLAPVYTTSDFTTFGESSYYGFVLGQVVADNEGLATFGKVLVNLDEESSYQGGTEKFVSAAASNALTTNTEPKFIVERNTADNQNYEQGVTERSINWGKWLAGAKVYTKFGDNRQFQTLDQTTINVNFIPTTAAEFTSIGSVSRTYAGGDSSAFGKINHSLIHAYSSVHEIKSVFDINFGTGVLTNGLLEICMDASCSNVSADKWQFGYSGTLNNGILLDATTDSAKHNNNAVTVTGTVVGGFTGSDADRFVGGFNYIENGNSGHYMRGSFLLENSSFLTAEAISGFEENEYGFLSFSDNINAGVYGGAAQRKGNSSNYLITDSRLNSSDWYNRNGSGASFHNEDINSFFRKGGAGVTVINNVGSLGDVITWGKWDGESGSEIRRDSLGSTYTDFDVDAYWFIAKPSAPAGTTGKWEYSNTLALQGSGSDGTLALADLKTFGFVLDLSNGNISLGKLKIQRDADWTVAFTGSAKNDTTGQGPFLSLAISSVKYNGSSIDHSNSSLAGMLINNGQQAATAFSLTKVGEESSPNVAGTILTQRASDDLEVDWGDWDTPVVDNWTSQLKDDIETSIFTSLQLTPDFVINSLKGSGEFQYDYANGAGAGYGSAAGELLSVSANMEVNFNNSTIDEGHLTVMTANEESWHSHFTGSFQGNSVTLTPETGSFTIGGTANAGTTSFGGAFTGEAAGGFVGAFEMIDALDNQNFVQGAFTLGKGASLSTD